MTKRKLVPIGFVAVLLVAVWLGYRGLTSETDGIILPVVQQSGEPDVKSVPRITIDDANASFSYPAKFTRLGSETSVAPVLSNYYFVKQQIGSWQISVQITRVASGQLQDDGGYNYRNVTPAKFSRDERTVGDNQVVVFSDAEQETFAQTAYLHKGSLAASVTMSGGTVSNYGQLQADFDAILASWRWK